MTEAKKRTAAEIITEAREVVDRLSLHIDDEGDIHHTLIDLEDAADELRELEDELSELEDES